MPRTLRNMKCCAADPGSIYSAFNGTWVPALRRTAKWRCTASGTREMSDRRNNSPLKHPHALLFAPRQRDDGKRQWQETMERDRRSAIDCLRCDLIASATLFKGTMMKTIAVIFAVATLALASTSADAKGCLKGAAVGGVAGHYAGHHGVLGAVAGCIYGRRHARQQELQRQQQGHGADVGQTGKGPDTGQTGM